MADSVYTADLFGSPADGEVPYLASDNTYSRNLEFVLPSAPGGGWGPLVCLAEFELARDFAIEQHSQATRKAYRSDFALFALWCAARGV